MFIYENEDNLFESDEEDECIIGDVNINFVSRHIALYF